MYFFIFSFIPIPTISVIEGSKNIKNLKKSFTNFKTAQLAVKCHTMNSSKNLSSAACTWDGIPPGNTVIHDHDQTSEFEQRTILKLTVCGA